MEAFLFYQSLAYLNNEKGNLKHVKKISSFLILKGRKSENIMEGGFIRAMLLNERALIPLWKK
jgi:hypothetical protein